MQLPRCRPQRPKQAMSELLHPCSCLVSLPLLAVRCPAVVPTLLAVAPRVPPRPRFLLFFSFYIYILIRFWGVMASFGVARSYFICCSMPIFHAPSAGSALSIFLRCSVVT